MSSLFESSVIKGKMENTENQYIFIIIIFVGAVTHLFFSNYYSMSGGYGPATALLWGYSLIIFAIFFKIIIDAKRASFLTGTTIQMMILVSLMLWLVIINVQNLYKLNTGKVPTSYSMYSSWTTIFILLHLLLYITNITNYNEENSKTFNKIMQNSSLISLITLFLIFVLIFVQHTILLNFSVDVL